MNGTTEALSRVKMDARSELRRCRRLLAWEVRIVVPPIILLIAPPKTLLWMVLRRSFSRSSLRQIRSSFEMRSVRRLRSDHHAYLGQRAGSGVGIIAGEHGEGYAP